MLVVGAVCSVNRKCSGACEKSVEGRIKERSVVLARVCRPSLRKKPFVDSCTYS